MAYILTSEPHEEFNHIGESLGMSDKRAIYFYMPIGKGRLYRQNMESASHNMKLYEFKTMEEAIDACNKVNEIYNDTFKIEEI